MRHGKWLGLAAVALAFFAGPAHAQTTLRYKFKDGEKLHYVMDQDIKMTMNVAGMDIEMKMKQGMDMNWDVQKVDDQGNARVRVKFGRVKMSMESPMGNVEVDSNAKGEDPEGPLGKIFGQLVKAMAAMEMTFTMAPDGEMKDVEISEEALKKIKAIPGADKFGGDALSPDGLKKMIGGGMVLPKGKITQGKTWTQKLAMKMPLGKVSGTTKFTYEGQVEKDGKKLEKIAVKPEYKVESDPDAKVQIKVKGQKDKGYAYFDAQAGRLVETTNLGTMELELEIGGMALTQNIQQNLTLRLRSRKR